MTQPHLASDDLAINAAQARIRDNLEARARACFDAALVRPSLGAVDAVKRALMALHHQWVAGLEQERQPVVAELADCQGERPEVFATDGLGPKICWRSKAARLTCLPGCDHGLDRPCVRFAQSDFGRNPAPVVSNAGQERRPVPCVPKYPTGESAAKAGDAA